MLGKIANSTFDCVPVDKPARNWQFKRCEEPIFIPVIGYMLLFNGEFSRYLNLAIELGGPDVPHGPASVEISTRLILIYFGLCLVALGSALFSFYCPPEIKEFPTSYAYRLSLDRITGESALKAMEERMMKSESYFHDRMRDLKASRQRAANPEARVEATAEYVRKVLSLYFELLNTRYRRIRIVSALVYIAGFAFLAIPSLQVFISVVSLLSKRMFS